MKMYVCMYVELLIITFFNIRSGGGVGGNEALWWKRGQERVQGRAKRGHLPLPGIYPVCICVDKLCVQTITYIRYIYKYAYIHTFIWYIHMHTFTQ